MPAGGQERLSGFVLERAVPILPAGRIPLYMRTRGPGEGAPNVKRWKEIWAGLKRGLAFLRGKPGPPGDDGGALLSLRAVSAGRRAAFTVSFCLCSHSYLP